MPSSFFSSTLYLLMKHNPLKSTSTGICQVIIVLVHLPGSTLLLFNITGSRDSVCWPICLICKFCLHLFLFFLPFTKLPSFGSHPARYLTLPSGHLPLTSSVFFLSLLQSPQLRIKETTVKSNSLFKIMHWGLMHISLERLYDKLSPETLTVWDSTSMMHDICCDTSINYGLGDVYV